MNKTCLISQGSKICKQRAEECVLWWVKRLACKNVFNYLKINLVPESMKITDSYLFIQRTQLEAASARIKNF